jgi:hypothetical protein
VVESAALSSKRSLPAHTRRIELVSAKGRLLRRFTFDECDVAAPSAGGVNEMRGVLRSQLLAALADQLPPGTIRFGAGVTGVALAQGVGGTWGVANCGVVLRGPTRSCHLD